VRSIHSTGSRHTLCTPFKPRKNESETPQLLCVQPWSTCTHRRGHNLGRTRQLGHRGPAEPRQDAHFTVPPAHREPVPTWVPPQSTNAQTNPAFSAALLPRARLIGVVGGARWGGVGPGARGGCGGEVGVGGEGGQEPAVWGVNVKDVLQEQGRSRKSVVGVLTRGWSRGEWLTSVSDSQAAM